MSQTQAKQYHVTTVDVRQEKRYELLQEANEWSDEVGSLRGSIEDGDGNTAGKYGELLFTELFGGRVADQYDYDVVYNGLTIDVKTKRRTVKAKPNYEASIADWNPDQTCDLYYFMSVRVGDVDEPYRYTDLLGYIPPSEYHNKATFYKKGDKDPSNGFTFSADCYNLPYNQLNRHGDMRGDLVVEL